MKGAWSKTNKLRARDQSLVVALMVKDLGECVRVLVCVSTYKKKKNQQFNRF